MLWSWVDHQVYSASWRGVSTSRPWCRVIWSAATSHGSKTITGVSAEPEAAEASRPVATDFGSSDPSVDRALYTSSRATHDLRVDGQIMELG